MGIETLIVAVTVFVATNIDDIFLLAALFGSGKLGAQNIVIGQFVGIAALVGGSALAGLAALTVPPGWISLLGLVPLVLGIRAFIQLYRGEDDDDDEAAEVATTARRNEILAVAGITIANGGDNVAVYIPLFASAPGTIAFHAVVFTALTGVWCWAGWYLASHKRTGAVIRRYGHILLPIVLVALGLEILSGAIVLLE